MEMTRVYLIDLIQTGRLPIAPKNVELIKIEENISHKSIINSKSNEAGLTVIGFMEEQLKYYQELFTGYNQIGDILFINAAGQKQIQ